MKEKNGEKKLLKHLLLFACNDYESRALQVKHTFIKFNNKGQKMGSKKKINSNSDNHIHTHTGKLNQPESAVSRDVCMHSKQQLGQHISNWFGASFILLHHNHWTS